MTAINNVTGDRLVTKATNDKYRDNYALAFGKKDKKEEKKCKNSK